MTREACWTSLFFYIFIFFYFLRTRPVYSRGLTLYSLLSVIIECCAWENIRWPSFVTDRFGVLCVWVRACFAGMRIGVVLFFWPVKFLLYF